MKILTIKHERTGLALWECQTLICTSNSHSIRSMRTAALEKVASFSDARIIYERPCDIRKTTPVTMFVKKLAYGYVAGAWAA